MGSHEHTPHAVTSGSHSGGHADAWHHHGAEEGRPQAEHGAIANPGVLVRWFVLIVVTLVAVVLALMVYFQHYITNEKAIRIENTALAGGAQSAKTQAEGELSRYKPLDKDAGTVQIPIDQAMQKVVEKYGAK
jgi:hypothetical protein